MYSKNGQLIGIGVLVIILLVAAMLASAVMAQANWNKGIRYEKYDVEKAGATFLTCETYTGKSGGTYALYKMTNDELWAIPALLIENNRCPNDFYYGDPTLYVNGVQR